MEFSKTEVTIVEQTEIQAAEKHLLELDALQLTVVGGGAGDVAFG